MVGTQTGEDWVRTWAKELEDAAKRGRPKQRPKKMSSNPTDLKPRALSASTSNSTLTGDINRWEEMALSRSRLLFAVCLLCGLFALLKLAVSDDPNVTTEVVSFVILLPVTFAPRLRNNRLAVGLAIASVYSVFTLSFVAVIVFTRTNDTFWYTLDVPRAQEQRPTLLSTAVHVLGAPVVLVVWTVRTGFEVLPLIWLGLALTACGTAVVGCIIWDQEKDSYNRIVTVLWATVPSLFVTVLLFDNEQYIARARKLARLANQAAQDQISQQQVAAINQQRIVGYIFHEVRNPINNITLASELALDMLASPNATQLSAHPPQLTREQSATQRQNSTPQPIDNGNGYLASIQSPLMSQVPDTHFSFASSQHTVSESPYLPSPSLPIHPNHPTLQVPVQTPQEIREMVEDIHQSTKAAVRVLNDALNLQKLQSGAFEFVHKPFLLEDLLSYTLRMVQSQMLHKRIEMTSSLDKPLKGAVVEGDFHRLQQVLMNFLSNASKFTPEEGKVSVHMYHLYQTEKAGTHYVRVRTSVHNTGPCIPPEAKAKMFQPWVQIRAGEQQQGQGSGLGLALCKAFVEKGHGGRVGFTSQPDTGTQFFFEITFKMCDRSAYVQASPNNIANRKSANITAAEEARSRKHVSVGEAVDLSAFNRPVTLPAPTDIVVEDTDATPRIELTAKSQETADDTSPGRPEQMGTTSSHDETRKMAEPLLTNSSTEPFNTAANGAMEPNGASVVACDVLIVEDSAMTRKLIGRTLAALGVTFDNCVDGQEAVDRIRSVGVEHYSIILMDKEMPRLDGFEATKRIREMGYAGPIVGCTGNAMDDQVAEFLQVGANHVLGKPVTQATLRSTLEHFGVLNKSADIVVQSTSPVARQRKLSAD